MKDLVNRVFAVRLWQFGQAPHVVHLQVRVLVPVAPLVLLRVLQQLAVVVSDSLLTSYAEQGPKSTVI